MAPVVRKPSSVRTPAVTGIAGIYSDPQHVILYTSNGELRQEFSIVLAARPLADTQRRAASQARSAGARWLSALGIRGDGSSPLSPPKVGHMFEG